LRDIAITQIISAMFAGGRRIDYQIIHNIWLLRTLVAAGVGACLSLSGCLLQGVMRNPHGHHHRLGRHRRCGGQLDVSAICPKNSPGSNHPALDEKSEPLCPAQHIRQTVRSRSAEDWHTDEDTMEALRNAYLDVKGEIEAVTDDDA
jgi:hypothetical protein